MPRNSPRFQPFEEIINFSEKDLVLTIAFENGFQHLRRLVADCLQIQLSQNEVPDFFSYALVENDSYPMVWEEEDQLLEIQTSGSFFLDMNNGQWSWNQNSKLLWQTEPGLGFGTMGLEMVAAFHLENHQQFFGLGEKTGGLNRRNSAFTMWNTDAFAYGDGKDPLYVSIPFYLAVHEGVCYGLLVDNSQKTRFNFGASNRRMVQISAAHGPLNLIFIPGPRPEDVLKRYHQLTGFMPMPPKWALGLQQCRYSYYPEHELLAVAQNYRNRHIPCDVLYLDIHYMDGYKVFTVDKNRFTDLKRTCSQLLEMGFKVVPIQDPGIKVENGYEPFENGNEKDVFVKYPDGENWVAGVWPGDCVFPDFSSPKTREWWSQKTASWVEETGVSGLWNDMNEPATWGQDVPDMLEFETEGRKGSHIEIHNVYGQLMAASTLEGLRLSRPGQRNFVLTRAGFAGIHRYAAVWSGDNMANEEHYLLGIRLVLGMAMSGVSFSGPDVGGFVDDAGKSLFVRWISVASFFPFFRLHSMIDSRDNEPWAYGELAEAIAGNYIRLRYKLLPMLYAAMYQYSKTGQPVLKPYFWEKPFLEFDPSFQHQFFFGNDILIIPAASSQDAVWAELPGGKWYHLLTGQQLEGNQSLWLACPIDQLPILVRGGSILVSQEAGSHTGNSGIARIDIHIFYGNENAILYGYDDDGNSENQSQEDFAEYKLSFDFEEQKLELEIINGKKEIQISGLYFWHFPHSVKKISFQGDDYLLEGAIFFWMDALPNFDPFEDKGKEYFSSCKKGIRI